MVVEESRHYTTDGIGLSEWRSLLPRDQIFVQLEPDGQFFAVSMYHQVRLGGIRVSTGTYVTNIHISSDRMLADRAKGLA
jgi:hypothetical protein